MKPRLIILSDLWGKRKANWLSSYVQLLEPYFSLQFYDACQLGGIDLNDYTESNLHQQFVNGGIDRAVKALLSLESEKINILAFSVGGIIAWKAGLAGVQINGLYAISSTRLRYETEIPSCPIKLYFGELDNYKPNKEWLENKDLAYAILKDQSHDLYTSLESIKSICSEIKNDIIKH